MTSRSIHDVLNPATPAGAYDALLTRVLPRARDHRRWEPADGPLPSLFVSHGAPPTLDDPQWLDDLFTWGQSLPKPRGIVVVSAHWENAPAALSASAAGTPLYYDFAGFNPRYYTLQYATPDATDLAHRIAGTIPSPEGVHQFTNRGLDHGAFIPLMAMYPAADVPVVQLSMPGLHPQALLRLGQRLRTLREEGILVIGSGFMTHSFAVLRQPALAGYTTAFDTWAADAISRGDVDTLTDYRTKAPGVDIVHPTADHYVPLLLTLGAATDPSTATSTIDGLRFGNSIRSIQID
ncbi:DODA-type extradiol aromatic ring-opening family dioxygenase [Lentzea aerocolonigenes]|uniref:DODA-type extradiol aromatic ring-opening family dioxygenase n=1 Tax=Lentzea aerocolonigenes TaxID=68170 RepID=UPI0004C44E67|nr:class III extradiol ring-cleavage dioxygenase [Lentzea aerocolonigenes]MCP2244291.1 Aromatic ring-opening dioxygenase, catalytic subunit, LigB family [Lentzea aerocolonigenes]